MRRTILCLVMILTMAMTGCKATKEEAPVDESKNISASLTFDKSLELEYASGFAVDYYNDGYVLIDVKGDGQYILVPEGKKVPEDLKEGIKVLEGPVDHIYLVAAATMDMFRSVDAMDTITLSGTAEDKWYIPEAKKAMQDGKMIYAGKYSEPDYETILDSDCDLAIESTMIYRAPEVLENLEGFGIPVLVDHSSYESTPQGRMEWVKLYGALTGKDKEANKVFEEQVDKMDEVMKQESTGKTVAFFNITSKGMANVRKPNDYVVSMIKMAGGKYIFDDLDDGDKESTTMNITLEEFYATAKDADYIVYNSVFDGGVGSIEELVGKYDMLKDFKAVQDGHAFCTTQALFQDSMKLGLVTKDFNTMLTMEDGEDEELQYMYRLE